MLGSLRIQDFIAQLNNPERAHQKTAVSILIHFGYLALDHLIRTIETEDEDVALFAAAVIVQIGPSATSALIKCLESQPSLACQRIVIQILSQIGDRQASAALRTVLQAIDDNHPLSELALDTLFNIEARHLHALRSSIENGL